MFNQKQAMHMDITCPKMWTSLPQTVIDILTLGWPCTPWTPAGKNRGWRDPRSETCPWALKFVAFMQPKTVIIENVPSFASDGGGTGENVVQALLAKVGYRGMCMLKNAGEDSCVQKTSRLN